MAECSPVVATALDAALTRLVTEHGFAARQVQAVRQKIEQMLRSTGWVAVRGAWQEHTLSRSDIILRDTALLEVLILQQCMTAILLASPLILDRRTLTTREGDAVAILGAVGGVGEVAVSDLARLRHRDSGFTERSTTFVARLAVGGRWVVMPAQDVTRIFVSHVPIIRGAGIDTVVAQTIPFCVPAP